MLCPGRLTFPALQGSASQPGAPRGRVSSNHPWTTWRPHSLKNKCPWLGEGPTQLCFRLLGASISPFPLSLSSRGDFLPGRGVPWVLEDWRGWGIAISWLPWRSLSVLCTGAHLPSSTTGTLRASRVAAHPERTRQGISGCSGPSRLGRGPAAPWEGPSLVGL